MKIDRTITLAATIFLLMLSNTYAGVIFQDDFESDSSSWLCSGGELSKWTAGYGDCGTTAGFGPEWKMGSGRNSNNAVYAWKKSGVSNGYRSESQKWLSGSAVKSEIYNRWYMKVPPASEFNKAISPGFKFWRYVLRENGYSLPPEVYINVQGSTFANGTLGVWVNGTTDFKSFTAVSNFNDGTWHCHEIRIKCNSTSTTADGIIEYWLDGNKKASYTGVMVGPVDNAAIHRVGVGIGNVSDSDWYQTNWSAIGFDDYVVSTDYVGPDDVVIPGPAPVVNLSADKTSGYIPLSVNFTDGSTNLPTAWDWDFGDGTHSALQNPTHTYTSAGIYTVTLTATNAYGSSIKSIPSYIVVNAVVNTTGSTTTSLFTESFEDTNFASRGWYDSTGGILSTTEHIDGSTKSLQMRFRAGDTKPYGGSPGRMLFTPSDQVYVSYWVKYSSNWVGQPAAYDHHEFYILTNKDNDYSGLAWTHLTAYIEQNHGRPVMTLQDGANINTSYINQDITNTTENRSVAGCNGDSDGYGNGSCYQNGDWFNGKVFMTALKYFADTAGSYYKNDWHHVVAYFKMNSIINGKAVKDGQIKYWFDDELAINYTDVVIRTGANPNMQFNQFVIAPYLGDGSTVDQSFWIDNLNVYTAASNSYGLSTPTGLKLQLVD